MQIPCWLFLRHGRRGFSYVGTAILPPDEGEGRKSRAKPRGFLQKRNPKGQFWQWWNPKARANYMEPEAVSQQKRNPRHNFGNSGTRWHARTMWNPKRSVSKSGTQGAISAMVEPDGARGRWETRSPSVKVRNPRTRVGGETFAEELNFYKCNV